MKVELISIIITTLNRPEEVVRLVRQIEDIKDEITKEIIIVNSGSPIELNQSEFSLPIREIMSSHKNQPYQRFLGSKIAKGEYLTFFDDDLIIINPLIFTKIKSSFTDNNVVGVGFHFRNESDEYHKNLSYSNKWKQFMSDLRHLEFNRKVGDCGIGGREPLNQEQSLFVNCLMGGNIPTCRKSVCENLWDAKILTLSSMSKGKGEDKYFTLNLNKFGRIRYYSEDSILHPSLESTYKSSYNYWRSEILRTRFLLCDHYSVIYKKNKTYNRLRIFLGTLLGYFLDIFLTNFSRKSMKLLIFLPKYLVYSIKYTWFLRETEMEFWESALSIDLSNYGG